MTRCVPQTTVSLALTILVTIGVGTARAQDDEKEPGWFDTAELTVVSTSGNAESSTVGFKNELTRAWESSDLVAAAGALRAESTVLTRTAAGVSPLSFQVAETAVSAVTAESYYVRGQYDHDVNPRTFWYAGTGWERNTFAGVQNRYSWGGGLGNTWVDRDSSTFKTGYGLTYTVQDDVATTTDNETFGGLRLSYDYRWQLTANTEFTSVLVADENLNETEDLRTDLINAVAVSINSRLALKVSWQLLFDNLPSQVGIPLSAVGGGLTGDTVFVELDSVDNLLTFALVANF